MSSEAEQAAELLSAQVSTVDSAQVLLIVLLARRARGHGKRMPLACRRHDRNEARVQRILEGLRVSRARDDPAGGEVPGASVPLRVRRCQRLKAGLEARRLKCGPSERVGLRHGAADPIWCMVVNGGVR